MPCCRRSSWPSAFRLIQCVTCAPTPLDGSHILHAILYRRPITNLNANPTDNNDCGQNDHNLVMCSKANNSCTREVQHGSGVEDQSACKDDAR